MSEEYNGPQPLHSGQVPEHGPENRFTLLEAVILGHLKDLEEGLKRLKALMLSMPDKRNG